MPKKNGNSLQYHLAFLQKAKERRRWSVASIPSYGYGSITPMNSNSQCSLNIDENNSCLCLQNGSYHHISSQTNSQSTYSAVSSVSPKLYHSGLVNTLAQHFSSNDSNPSLDEDNRLLSTVPYFRPRSRSLSSPVRSPAVDSKNNLNLSTSKENLNYLNSQSSPIKLGTLTFRRRSRSLSSPIRSPGIENRFVQMSYVYKERFPNAIKQMNEKLEKFINDNPELIPEIASDAVTRFVHHQAIEMAKDCLQKSKDELLTSNYFYEMTEGLEKLLAESKEKSSSAVQHLKKLIKQLMLIVSRPARLLECLEFNPEEFYRFLEAAEGQAKTIQGIKKDLPQYIINKLGLTKDPLTEFNQLNEHLFENVNSIDKQNKLETEDSLNSSFIKLPSEKDYETIKLISNGAYGAVYLVKHIETNQRFAMKKINKQNLALRNQIEQAFAERDIMCFTDNPFVVSLFCSFETKLYLCMVMEYVEGGDCATLLKSMGPLPVDLSKFYFAETVLAVEYLHSYGIVHRDLKPDNLLITALGHIKLTDFGLSKIGLMNLATNLYEGYLDKDTKQFNDKQVYGTPEYIAPEVILRQGYGKPVDWWSMGIILYEFLIGCVPFFGETAEELFSHVINDEIEWPSNEDWPLPEEAKILITQFLMPNPIDRLGTSGAAEVKDHPFFDGINWDALLRQKAEFVPQLIDEDDTSYFDTRLDRYNHDLEDSEGFNDSDDSPLFSSFSSCSPRYHKVYSKLERSIEKEKLSTNIEDIKQSSQIFTNESSSSSKSSTNKQSSELNYDESSKETNDSSNGKKDKLHEAFNKQLAIKDILKFVSDSNQTESNDKSMNSIKENKEENYLKTEENNQSENEKRPLTPSIKETPPDDSNYEEKDNSGEENKSYDENKLSLLTKIRPVTKSASASGLSQIIFEPKTQRRFTLLDNRHLEHEENCLSSNNNKSSLTVHDQTDMFKNTLNKNKLSKNLLESSPSKQFSRHSGYLRKSSLRQIGSPYCSSASSRDNSPSHDLINKRKSFNKLQNSDKLSADINLNNSLNNLCKLKPPVILRKSNRGFGFSFKAIRVYYGDSDIYTVHHLVMNVEPNSPAFEAGLKTGDLITHINSEPLQGLLHHQVLQLVLSGSDTIQIRTTPLETTSIKSGGRKRNPNAIRLAKRGTGVNKHFYSHKKSYSGLTHSSNEANSGSQNTLSPTILKRNDSEKKRKSSSLIRRLSSKRSSADIQQSTPTCSNVCLQEDLNSKITSSKSFQHLNKEDKIQINLNQQSTSFDPYQNNSPELNSSYFSRNLNNNSNASTPVSNNKSQIISSSQYNRPNTLHGLKHKLVQTFRSPRRKSCGNIPLSPLARTSSPSSACLNSSSGSNLVTESPTRSPSPLAFSNNGQQTNYRHSQQYHRHNHRQNSSTHCQLQFNNCTSNNTLKPLNSSSGSSNNQVLSPCLTVNCSSNKNKTKNLAQSPVIESDDNNSVTSLDSNNCKFNTSINKKSHDSSSSHGVSKQKTNRY